MTPIMKERIYNRIKHLLDQNITVWMYCPSMVTLSSIEKRGEAYICIDDDGNEHPMVENDESYERVSYTAPLFDD